MAIAKFKQSKPQKKGGQPKTHTQQTTQKSGHQRNTPTPWSDFFVGQKSHVERERRDQMLQHDCNCMHVLPLLHVVQQPWSSHRGQEFENISESSSGKCRSFFCGRELLYVIVLQETGLSWMDDSESNLLIKIRDGRSSQMSTLRKIIHPGTGFCCNSFTTFPVGLWNNLIQGAMSKSSLNQRIGNIQRSCRAPMTLPKLEITTRARSKYLNVNPSHLWCFF